MARIQINSFGVKRLSSRLAQAPAKFIEIARDEIREAGDQVAKDWSDAIPEGRGGGWNAQMKNIQAQATTPGGTSVYVRMGWLAGGPQAANGSGTWFIYHDTGYNMFNSGYFVSGLGQYLKRQSQLADEIDKAQERMETRILRFLKG